LLLTINNNIYMKELNKILIASHETTDHILACLSVL
jgi:hypothetical protein